MSNDPRLSQSSTQESAKCSSAMWYLANTNVRITQIYLQVASTVLVCYSRSKYQRLEYIIWIVK